MPRMKDWLKLLNLGVTRSHFGCYAPAFRSSQWLARCGFMERMGQRWWPYLGAVYVVHAIKRVKGMTIIGPAWSRGKVAAPKAVPVTNSANHGSTHRARDGAPPTEKAKQS
jgi:hypothetical protein